MLLRSQFDSSYFYMMRSVNFVITFQVFLSLSVYLFGIRFRLEHLTQTLLYLDLWSGESERIVFIAHVFNKVIYVTPSLFSLLHRQR